MSSFQRSEPYPVSITLALTNGHRTFASTKIQRTFRRPFPAKTSGANGHHPGVPLFELYAVMCSITQIQRRLRRLSPTPVISSLTPTSSSVTTAHFWPKVSIPSRLPHRSRSVLPFPCTFGGRPIKSPSLFLSMFLFSVTMTGPSSSLCLSASCAPMDEQTPSRSPRRCHSVLLFPCTFGGHPYQIPISPPLTFFVHSHHDRSFLEIMSVHLPCAYGSTDAAMSFSKTRCVLAAPFRHRRTTGAPPRVGTRAGSQDPPSGCPSPKSGCPPPSPPLVTLLSPF
jgi:hypothetical protein